MYMEYEEFRAHQRELAAVVQQFAREEGGRHSHSNGAEVLALAGVRASCTTGPHGLLRNWQNAARRKIKTLVTCDADPAHYKRTPPPYSIEAGMNGGLGRDETDDPINLAGSGPVPIEPREG